MDSSHMVPAPTTQREPMAMYTSPFRMLAHGLRPAASSSLGFPQLRHQAVAHLASQQEDDYAVPSTPERAGEAASVDVMAAREAASETGILSSDMQPILEDETVPVDAPLGRSTSEYGMMETPESLALAHEVEEDPASVAGVPSGNVPAAVDRMRPNLTPRQQQAARVAATAESARMGGLRPTFARLPSGSEADAQGRMRRLNRPPSEMGFPPGRLFPSFDSPFPGMIFF